LIKKKLLDNFKNIKNIANLNLLKYVKVLLSKNGLSKNVGFYLFIPFIIFHTITLFVFYSYNLDLLLNRVKDLIFSKNKMKIKRGDKNEENSKEIIKLESKDKKKKEIEDFKNKLNLMNNNNIINNDANNINNDAITDNKKIQFMKKGKMVSKRKKIKIKKGQLTHDNINNIINNIFINDNNNNYLRNNIIIINKKKNETINISEKIRKIAENKQSESLMDYNEEEINDLSYDLALQNDKRSYWQYYISLIKTKHEVFYAFFYSNDYNLKIIKIDF
jgi:hypothetical protein